MTARASDTAKPWPAAAWLIDVARLEPLLSENDLADPLLAPSQRGGFASAPPARRAARLGLRLLLEAHFGARWRGGDIAFTPEGKPYIDGLPGAFSVSHCPGWALIALGPVTAIGADIEQDRPVRINPARQQKIMDAAVRVARGVPLPQPAPFLQAWARLEALAKADGRGIGRTLTALGAWGRPAEDSAAIPDAALSAFCVHDLDLGAGLYAALATSGQAGPVPVRVLPADAAGLAALRSGAAPAMQYDIDLAAAPGQKGPVRSVAQPG